MCFIIYLYDFSVRVRMGKKREEMSGKQTNLSIKNPSVAGNSTRDNGSLARRKKEFFFWIICLHFGSYPVLCWNTRPIRINLPYSNPTISFFIFKIYEFKKIKNHFCSF